jgi:hypothetical protein
MRLSTVLLGASVLAVVPTMPRPKNVDEQDLDIAPAGGSQENTLVSSAESGEKRRVVGLGGGDASPRQISQLPQEAILSFFARDLLARLVKATATVRRDRTNPAARCGFTTTDALRSPYKVLSSTSYWNPALSSAKGSKYIGYPQRGKEPRDWRRVPTPPDLPPRISSTS